MTLDVKKIRAATGLSQPEFAERYGFKLPTLRDWEQGRKSPHNTARTLLLVISESPDIVSDALARAAIRRPAKVRAA